MGDNAEGKNVVINFMSLSTEAKRDKYVILALINIFAKVIRRKKKFSNSNNKFYFILYIYIHIEKRKRIAGKISISWLYTDQTLFLYFKYSSNSVHKRIELNDQISTRDARDFASKVTGKFHLNKK